MQQVVRGFTLVELIVFVGTITIMAAMAYPRFIMIETGARKALVTSLGSSVSAAARQAHYLWIIKGKPAAIDMEGQTITMLNGYPDEASIDNSLMDYSGFQFNNAAVARFSKIGAPLRNTCMVTYADAVAGSRPAVTVFTSGC